MSAASARDAAVMAKHTDLTVAKILFAQIVMEKEVFDMTDKTEEQLAKEKASVDAMKNAKANMDAALSRISSLELALMRATESLIRAKANIGSNVYCYPSGGAAKLVHQRIDEEIADLRKVL
jgi:hypothetical protein